MLGIDFPSMGLETTNETPSWQRFYMSFNSDIEQWTGINPFP